MNTDVVYAAQVAKLLNCTTDDVALLVTKGKLHALGRPRINGVKLFSSIELLTLVADRDWLDDATKTIGQFWQRKNERRHGSRAKGHDAREVLPIPRNTRKAGRKPSTISSAIGSGAESDPMAPGCTPTT